MSGRVSLVLLGVVELSEVTAPGGVEQTGPDRTMRHQSRCARPQIWFGWKLFRLIVVKFYAET